MLIASAGCHILLVIHFSCTFDVHVDLHVEATRIAVMHLLDASSSCSLQVTSPSCIS